MKKEIKCEKLAAYRYTWPGRDESLICKDCIEQLLAVANAIGLPLQIIPLPKKDREMCLECMQILSKEV